MKALLTVETVLTTARSTLSLPLPNAGPATRWQDLGLDSLDVAEVVVELEKSIGLAIPWRLCEPHLTLAEFVDAVSRAAAVPVPEED
jgi:acyl carrier protein